MDGDVAQVEIALPRSAIGERAATGTLKIPQRIERLPMTSHQRMIAFVVVLSVFFDAVDMGAMTFLLPSLKEAFGLGARTAGLLGSMSMAGMLVGSLVAGRLADRVGRKVMLQYSMILWGLSGLALALSWNVPSLLVFRFLLGVGLGAEYPVANAMLPEFLPAKSRGRYMTVMEGLAPIGVITAGLVAYLVLPQIGWRAVFVAEAIPAFWLFVVRRRVPESPRWLEAVGRNDEADAVTRGIEDEVRRRTDRELPPVAEARVVESRVGRARFIDLWSGPYWKRTLMLWILWPAAMFGYWAINVWLGAMLVDKGFTIMKSIGYVILITSGGIPGFLVATVLTDKVGRKALVIAGLLGTALMAYLYGRASTLAWLIGLGMSMQYFMWILWSTVYAFTPEMYPTRMRATGTGLGMAIGRIGAIAGPSATGLILASSYGQSMVFNLGAAMFIFAAIAVLVLAPETKNKSLEELGT